MSFRQDKLILLLDSRTSSAVRRTASKQLADLTYKVFRAARPDPDVKRERPDPGDDVKPENADAVSLHVEVSEDEAWSEVLETISKLVPLLRSKQSESRAAAANALGLLAAVIPPYSAVSLDKVSSVPFETAAIDLPDLVRTGGTLLASAGREYVAKPAPGDKAKRRQAMMGSLGLGGTVGWGDDVDKVIGDEEEDVDMSAKGSRGQSQSAAPTPPEPSKDIFEGLSARQITMIKRKKGNMAEEANKMRKLNARVAGPSGSHASASTTPTPQASPSKSSTPLPTVSSESVTIDPGAKARAAAASGGQFEPVVDDDGNPISETEKYRIKIAPGCSPWISVLDEIIPLLSDPAWQARHGGALGVMEIIRSLPPLNDEILTYVARHLLTLLALDRFGDFLGDTVVAPVRETSAQALGICLKHLSALGTREVHDTLIAMVRQRWAKRGKEAHDRQKWEKFSWELRHAGLLGLKYEVAVRGDLVPRIDKGETSEKAGVEADVKPINGHFAVDQLIEDVLDVSILSMQDVDDDVRTVAASTLLPIAGQLARTLPDARLSALFNTLWDCLKNEKDELGSSIGAVMDLLGNMLSYERFISLFIDAKKPDSLELISRIYPFLRHAIVSVRLAIVSALARLTNIEDIDRERFQHAEYFSYLFENIILEQDPEIRNLSLAAWTPGIQEMANNTGEVIGIETFYSLVMTPVGQPFDETLFSDRPKTGHNIDKAMMAGDVGLVDSEVVWATRMTASRALGFLRSLRLEEDLDYLRSALSSGSAHKLIIASTIVSEWAYEVDRSSPQATSLGEADEAAAKLAATLTLIVDSPPRDTYAEMTTLLQRIQADSQALLNAFGTELKVPAKLIPSLPKKVDTSKQASDKAFTLAIAQSAVTTHFDALLAQAPKTAPKAAVQGLQDRQRKVMASIGYFSVMKERYDVQVAAAAAGALVSLRVLPIKFGSLIKAIMESIKREESVVLQTRSACSIAAFISHCSSPLFTRPVNPSNKVISNLFTFLCSDTAVTPVFKPDSAITEGIETLREEKEAAVKAAKKKGKTAHAVDDEETEAQYGMRIARRGALEAFKALAKAFGGDLFDKVPKSWDGLAGMLLSTFVPGSTVEAVDDKLRSTPQAGQDVVDALTCLRLIAPELDSNLRPRLTAVLPSITLALQSSYTIIRHTAARCLAVLCDVMTDQAMKAVVDMVVPLIGDARRVQARQGAVEAVHHVIKLLDIKALPYVLFLIVPVLGRMSDPDEHVRLLSTSTFASLIKMVPLEAGLPDPPNFSAELLAKRDEERQFLMQLLDGSKAEQYQIPIKIKADLRQYQKDGVSWLAFLAKYQLHGVLCDDMGLGKSLQSICIIGSKHHERLAKHRLTGSVDSAHLPSLIVCPPTLTGHWYYEILKFTDDLRPIQYVGSHAQRAALRPSLRAHDVVIASYETIRADIADLSKIDWLYCVLDEGHIIKNAKTKLSAAVKQIKSQHRLLLSGTPIQNNLLELWSLFDFLMPGFLGTERSFQEKFGKPVMADREGKATPKEREAAAAALESLHKQVLPFLLRRLKEDVLSDLPPKIIQDYYCDLSPIQSVLYDEFSKSRAAEEAGEEVQEGAAGQGHVFQSLQYLRKLCNHPALVLQQEPETRWDELRKRAGLGKEVGLKDVGNAPKLEALRQLLNDCGIGLPPAEKVDDLPSHRVLIFCQLRPMLDLIETSLFATHMPSVTYMRMDGSTDPRKRHAVVQTFNDNPAVDVLLLTTSVGGLGLNLTGADTVIFVDHDWNPMKDLQAMDRAHRLGQRKVVNVYRLIMRGTLEEKIMGLQRFKLNIASSVVTQQNAGLGSMNTGEVLDLFKVSADSEPGKDKVAKAGNGNGPASVSKVLEGLDDLPPDDEYADLSLSNFLSKV